MKKYYRYFGGFIKTQEAWLNKVSSQGYKLEKVGKLLYEFEECRPNEYQYCVEFVGEKKKEDVESYKSFLEEMGYTVFYKNMNLNYSVGKIKYRPWAQKGGRIATAKTNFNKELLIVEKVHDGNPFTLHTTCNDKAGYYSRIRRMWAGLFLIFALFSVVVHGVVTAAFALICLFPVFFYGKEIGKCKKDSEINEE